MNELEKTYLDNNIKIIMRQTDYNKETAKHALKLHDNSIEKVIEDFLNVKPVMTEQKSTNQQIYTEIRNMLKEQR